MACFFLPSHNPQVFGHFFLAFFFVHLFRHFIILHFLIFQRSAHSPRLALAPPWFASLISIILKFRNINKNRVFCSLKYLYQLKLICFTRLVIATKPTSLRTASPHNVIISTTFCVYNLFPVASCICLIFTI